MFVIFDWFNYLVPDSSTNAVTASLNWLRSVDCFQTKRIMIYKKIAVHSKCLVFLYVFFLFLLSCIKNWFRVRFHIYIWIWCVSVQHTHPRHRPLQCCGFRGTTLQWGYHGSSCFDIRYGSDTYLPCSWLCVAQRLWKVPLLSADDTDHSDWHRHYGCSAEWSRYRLCGSSSPTWIPMTCSALPSLLTVHVTALKWILSEWLTAFCLLWILVMCLSYPSWPVFQFYF